MDKIALISLGCAKNLVDSEVMTGHLRRAGYLFTTDIEHAEIIIINTCGFIKPAKQEAEKHLIQALETKSKNPDIKVIITGCYVERDQSLLEKTYPEVDAWLGVKDYNKIASVIEKKPFQKSNQSYLYDHNSPRFVSTSPVWAYVKISEGCSHKCSFCSIPLIKGKYQSRNIESILLETTQLAEQGILEVNLISQDSTYFGREKGIKDGLTQLLRSLIDVSGIQWIRLMYGYPEEITDSLLEVMKENKICSYLDIPFQHSHPDIIKSMKRGLDKTKSLKLLDKIRAELPDISIRTSIIVGYPTEGEKEFSSLLDFIKQAHFDHLGVFTYWQEKGTGAYNLGDPVSFPEKQKRYDEAMELQAEISHTNNKRFKGQTIEMLFEAPLDETSTTWMGRGQNQAPEVDGMIFCDIPNSKFQSEKKILPVEILQTDVYDLYGVIKE